MIVYLIELYPQGSSGLLMQRKRELKKKEQQLESSGNDDEEGVGDRGNPHSSASNTPSEVGTPVAKRAKRVHFSNAQSDTLSTDKAIKRKASAGVSSCYS